VPANDAEADIPAPITGILPRHAGASGKNHMIDAMVEP
jgi:hypothetical protein